MSRLGRSYPNLQRRPALVILAAAGNNYVDSGTLTASFTLSGVDVIGYADSGTLTATFTLSGADVIGYTDSGTLTASFILSGSDVIGYVDAGTLTAAFALSGSDVYTPFGGTAYTDSGTLTAAFSLSGSDVIGYTDSGTLTAAFVLTGTDASGHTDAGTLTATFTLSGADSHGYVDAGTLTLGFALSGSDAFQGVDTGTLTATHVLSGVDIYLPSGVTVTTTALYGYVTGTPGSGVVTPTGQAGLIIVGSTANPGQTGATGLPLAGYAPQDICVLGYSNQVLGGVDVTTVEGLIGRQFHGLRQNQAYTVTGVSTAITEYDAGRTTSYRAIQFDTLPGGWAAAATGAADTQLTAFCNSVTAANRWTTQNPFLVCLHHEATLSPFGTTGFLASDYKAMWAHCVPVMLATGAPIAFAYVGWDRMFVGSGGVGPPTAGQGIDDLDPGPSLYRYIGSDVYNNLDSPGVLRYGIYAATLLDPIRNAAITRGKDWIIGEMGCPDGTTTLDHQQKAFWLDGLRVYLDGCGTTSPGVCRALLTTIKASAENFNVDSSAESLAAWQRLGGDVYYS